MPLPSSGLGGALVSATSTSPLGNTYSQRGWSNSAAKAATRVPGAATGRGAGRQPTAGAIFTVGSTVCTGCGNTGAVPEPSDTASVQSPRRLTKGVPLLTKTGGGVAADGPSWGTFCQRGKPQCKAELVHHVTPVRVLRQRLPQKRGLRRRPIRCVRQAHALCHGRVQRDEALNLLRMVGQAELGKSWWKWCM